MKRLAFAITLLVLILVGCRAGTAPSPSDLPTPPTTDASTSSQFPVTLTHRLGTITLNAPPQRVVALGVNDIDTAIALGVAPVAISADPFTPDGISPWLQGRIEPGTTEILSADPDRSHAEIKALNPDLILATGYFGIDDSYESLAQLAPTLADIKGPNLDSWQAQTLAIGQALGKPEQAQTLITETEQQIAAVQERNPGLESKTFSLSYVLEPTRLITLISSEDFAAKFFGAMGMTLTPGVQQLDQNPANPSNATLTPDQIDHIDADLVLVAFDTPQLRAGTEANPDFQRLTAVQQGNYEAIDLALASTLRYPSILSIPYLLDRLDRILTRVAATPN